MNTKDTRYFTHDHDARHDPKIEALIRIWDVVGYAYYFMTIEIMRAEKGYCLKEKTYVFESLSHQFKIPVDKVKQFLQDCIDLELFERDGQNIFSPSLLKRMIKLDTIRERKRAGAYAMHERLGHNITHDGKEPTD
jgi:hypothetical protein